ncbi:GNAT family N-acetyltransferase [Arcticibacter eurypsychrophilus]|uniref:GNAT family N-acetyltransferase n=1 Tax=Arcticibacter eurypsychrophilus TaxID=1434752 RepID=UPI00084CFABE|nr:GNAT family N-acetyltransferase [Arcticibacter eurypsychrophilus]
MKYQDIELVNNKKEHSFELTVDGKRSFIDYNHIKETYNLLHTEVPESQHGQGIAEAIVEKTLQYLEENHFKMVPSCSYIQVFLKRHPKWNKLVAQD